ncbi:MAG TPA: bifunctional UDP-N-acetylglucosamine diphosphorylase/glucosamine-1-phosphate N-acetyltransferase GlmU [Drouetiella sp.]
MTTRKNTRAVLLAAGQGKRMKSAKPKVLHDVLGKTVLGRVLDAVDELGIDHVHVVIGHEADQVKAFLDANPPKTPYSVHLQEPQHGTGHAVQQVVPSLEGFTGTLLVSVADTPLLQGSTLAALVDGHIEHKSVVTLLTTDVEDAKSYGRILRSADGAVTGIIEDKDASPEQKKIREINPAIYCFEWPTVKPGLYELKNDNRQNEYYLTDMVAWAYNAKHKTSGIKTTDWREVAGINSRLELAEATRLLRDMTIQRLALESGVTVVDPATTWIAPEVSIGQDSMVLPGCFMTGTVEIGSNCLIGPHTTMKGPVTIGDGTSVAQSHVYNSVVGRNCKVGPFSHLRDGNEIGDNVRLGNFVEIKKSEIGNKTNVSHLSYVGDASVGSGANLGAGTITANYNHTTKKKSRTTIGDNASTGSNSVLVAPISLGDDASVAAGTVATKDVPAGALAVGRARQENKEGWTKRLAKTSST